MENINFSLKDINTNYSEDNVFDDSYFFTYDIEQLKNYYNINFSVKGLTHILNYYGLMKKNLIKYEMIQIILFFESDPLNKIIVEKRLRLWSNIKELKTDPYFSKYILF